jgi:hypothetical protein
MHRGNIKWQKSLGGSSADEAADIRETADGNYIACGSAQSEDGDVTGHHGNNHLMNDYWILN